MSVLRAPARTRSAGTAADNAVLTSTDIQSGRPPTGTGFRTAEDDAPQVRPGDVLIPVIGRQIIARVATPDQVGAELGPGVQVLRIDPSLFDPWFIAGLLSRTDTRHFTGRASSTSGGALRIDLRRLTIPVLTLSDQREYGQAFRQLAAFRAGLERVTATGAALAREISDGLTSGTLDVRADRDRLNPPRRAAMSGDA